MSSKDFLLLRISSEDKEKIRETASRRGESLTTFVRRVCLREADNELKKEAKKMEQVETRPKHTGVPSFFRYGCLEATRGGESGYWNAGWHLAIHTYEQMPYDIEDDEQWEEMLDELREAAGNEDVDAVWDWYCQVFPKCMELVPIRRKDQFVKGVMQAWEDDRI